MEDNFGGQEGGEEKVEGGRTPMQKAPPKSLRATQGQGSREWSIDVRRGGDCGGEAAGDGGGGVWRVETDEIRWIYATTRKGWRVGVRRDQNMRKCWKACGVLSCY